MTKRIKWTVKQMNDVHHGPEKKAGGVKNFIERQNYVVKLSS